MNTCTALACRDNFQAAFDDLLAVEPQRQQKAIVEQRDKARMRRLMRSFAEIGGWAHDMGFIRMREEVYAEPLPLPAPQVFYTDLERRVVEGVGIPPHLMPEAPRRISTADNRRDALVGAAYAADSVANITFGLDMARAGVRDQSAMVLTVIKSREGVPNKNGRVYPAKPVL